MSELIAISPSQHARHSFIPRRGYQFAADLNTVPVLLAELNRLLPHYLLAFLPQGDAFTPVALLGFGSHGNLYLNPQGQWLGDYVPSALRGYPFQLATKDDGQLVFCMHQQHLCVSNQEGEPLFNEEGELAKLVAQCLDFLRQCEQNRQLTQAACAALAAHELIVPWELAVAQPDAKPQSLKGLYRLDEAALSALPPEPFAALRQSGALALAYAQLFTQSQHHQLTKRIQHQANSPAPAQPEPDLGMQIDENNDTLKFNF